MIQVLLRWRLIVAFLSRRLVYASLRRRLIHAFLRWRLIDAFLRRWLIVDFWGLGHQAFLGSIVLMWHVDGVCNRWPQDIVV